MYIKKIKIENFRSINKVELELDKMNIFYGLNDAGKSNVLKALNLFFNGVTEPSKPYDFERDFCQFNLAKKSKKAKEIKIELTLCYYVNQEEFKWKKIWREHGLYDESIDASHKKLAWARSLIYRYVPAMKDELYFSQLLKEFYKVFSSSINEELKNASGRFVKVISENTKQLSSEILSSLHIDTQVSFPSNLSSLFSTLEFQTKNRNGNKISLNNRGDGIKIRHIPSVLKFFSEQENISRGQGSIKVHTIWGYEEPENNLELKAAFEKAEQFKNYANNIQILLTTHSPAFYSLSDDEESVKLYHTTVSEKENEYFTQYKLIDNCISSAYNLDDGYLKLISPIIAKKVEEMKEFKSQIEQLKKDNLFINNVIFVEGKTDKQIIEFYIMNKYQNLNLVVVDCGGCNQVKNNLISWLYNPKIDDVSHNYYALALFDNDESGRKSKNELHNYVCDVFKDSKRRKVEYLELKCPAHLKNIREKIKDNYNLTIESMFDYSVFLHAKNEGWLEDRELSNLLDGIKKDPNLSINQYIEKIFQSEEQFFIRYQIKENKKQNFAEYVIKQDISIFSELEKSLSKFIEKLLQVESKK